MSKINTHIYIIVINKDERLEWGFENHNCVRIIGANVFSLTSPVAIAHNSQGVSVCICDLEQVKGIVENLKKDTKNNINIRLFIHFGKTDIRDFNTELIANKLSALDVSCENCKAIPFVGKEREQQAKWVPIIYEFRDWQKDLLKYPEEKEFLSYITNLNKAWDFAIKHFGKLLAMRLLIETLFPLYIDMRNYFDLRIPESTNESEKERFYVSIVDHIKMINDDMMNNKKVDIKTLAHLSQSIPNRLAEDLDPIFSGTFTIDHLGRAITIFNKFFQELSKDYTKQV